jgi:hypothetical protein
VTFTAPSNVGGSAITNYYAVSNPGQITASSVTSPVTVTGLTNGTNYTFTVWALNSFGPSAYSAASGSVTPSPPYIEEVFSTWLYSGTGSAQTITNGIDLSTKGGLVWTKSRSAAIAHSFFDTLRGSTKRLNSATTAAEATDVNSLTSFNSSGFDLGSASVSNGSGNTYASWTFREQPKFFDVVTWTGNGTTQAINHNLGSTPGCIIVKSTTTDSNWAVYHRGASSGFFYLNSAAAVDTGGTSDNHFGNNSVVVAPTSTQFTVGNSISVNSSGQTYVAYLFAHDAGGFGLTGTDNVITCGSFTTSANQADVNLGWEPQWVLVKRVDSSVEGYWILIDNMRGVNANNSNVLFPNESNAEQFGLPQGQIAFGRPSSTGFYFNTGGLSGTPQYIYIAIRRGPMKTPTTGTSVFTPIAQNQPAGTLTTVGFVADAVLARPRNSTASNVMQTRLIGYATANNTNAQSLITNTTGAENGASATYYNVWNLTAQIGNAISSVNSIAWMFGRAPGVFDVVCYTGTGVARTVSHNLGVAPELMIVKCRSAVRDWVVYSAAITANNFLYLNLTDASAAGSFWNSTSPTSSVFTVGDPARVNGSGATYVAYLFASCPGVSKCGSYTGTGALQTINCGFTGGARFVLIKRTDDTGDWFVYDSARGITSGNDPYLLMNSTAAEVTNTNYVDTTSVGFQVTAAAPAGLNANGGTFVFLAIS